MITHEEETLRKTGQPFLSTCQPLLGDHEYRDSNFFTAVLYKVKQYSKDLDRILSMRFWVFYYCRCFQFQVVSVQVIPCLVSVQSLGYQSGSIDSNLKATYVWSSSLNQLPFTEACFFFFFLVFPVCASGMVVKVT